MKIIDKINAKLRDGQQFFSFEFFPPRTEEGMENLFDRQDRMISYGPLFCDITWGAGGSSAEATLNIANTMQNMICVESMMHLTCTNMPVEMLKDALDKVKAEGIQNILALRGDPPKGQESFKTIEGGFSCALDLVKYIRESYGDYFGIGVAGYPEAHPDGIADDPAKNEESYRKDLAYLKEKIDAGADFIITQLFYDTDRFLKFVDDCRAIGITCPILPGIMPIMTYQGFKRMTGFCKTYVPAEITERLEEIKDDDEAVKLYGIELGTQMCRKILDAGLLGIHMYTLNLERSAVAILENLGLIDRQRAARTLPWRKPSTHKRTAEDVRPIFWSNRPKSYIRRTADWDEFPSGRWGDSRSPAYGTLSDYQFMRPHTSRTTRKQKALESWGTSLSSVDDIIAVFVKFVSGKISLLPWSELEDGVLQSETYRIQSQLASINQQGYLTINSQPAVNGAPSSDPNVGWGGHNGYVYQKAYVEFFVAPDKFAALEAKLQQLPSITYLGVNAAGDLKANVGMSDINAVTWGVFPGKEVVQPTVVDPVSFMVWKDEAFQLWTEEWGSIYEEGSASRSLLEHVASTWYLVSIVDNDYIAGNLFHTVFGV